MKHRSEKQLGERRDGVHGLVRLALPGVAAPALALAFSALFSAVFTRELVGYWGNAAGGLVAFFAAVFVASRLGRERVGLSISLGLGLTWGLLILILIPFAVINNGPLRSLLVLLGEIALAIVFAQWLERRLRHSSMRMGQEADRRAD